MTDSTASLRRRIDGATDLHSVVRTMKAIAASSIGQYENSVHAITGYVRAVESGLSVCFRHDALPQTAPETVSSTGMIAVVVFGSDQGLVGKFNETIVNDALQALHGLTGKRHRVWAVGERAQGRLIDAGVPLAGYFAVPNCVEAIASLVGQILLATEADAGIREKAELHLFYNRIAPASVFASIHERLLPLDAAWRRELCLRPWPAGRQPEVLGDGADVLQALIGEYLFSCLFRACAESLASENASRLAAMQRAEKNIDELLQSLLGTFHRVRQSGIDEELFDVIAGSELSGNL